jgi:hypothetical protein
MGVARQRAKIDKTKSTIRKLHEIIVPHYESYVRRRVPLSVPPASRADAREIARIRLKNIRMLLVREMPDCWDDVYDVAAVGALSGSNAYLATGPVRAYAAMKALGPTSGNGNAECLHMVVWRGIGAPEVMEHFRQDEVGDIDGDGASEFLDGWNRPLVYLRWAPGFSSTAATRLSPVQFADPTNYHDPFDPQRVDVNGYALIPFIASAGPDGLLGFNDLPTGGWQQFMASPGLGTIVGLFNPALGSPSNPAALRDNITNHDLTTK